MKASHRQIVRGLRALLVAMPLSVQAATTVTVKVTVVAPPPCVINGNRTIEVDFGEVMIAQIDGKNYRMPVNYSLSCSGQSKNAMKLQVQGTGAAFDATALKTNKTGLGIELQQGSSKLAVNGWLNFTYPNTPTLWAVPIKQSGVTLSVGEFTAGATMKVDYQ
ncbi:fimbrial protein [Serratia marcescens]|uniref:fimbrial protein n=1 Tax=Serratia marcescens TaxID=615 RepID=UPI001A1965AF|nr:fimbrial protein [Serratia marcescens]HAT5020735.1 fimbrial protein [Serratia marcescens]